MPGVLDAWHQQGLPTSVRTEKDIYEYFGFQTRPQPLPLNTSMDPPVASRVIEETDEYRVEMGGWGRTTKVIWTSSTLPMAIDWTVKDETSWQTFKRRLEFHAGRIGDDLKQVVAENAVTGHLNSFGRMGFFWFPRDLMGMNGFAFHTMRNPNGYMIFLRHG